MAMDTVTGHRGDERPAWDSGRRDAVSRGGSGLREVDDVRPGGVPVVVPPRRSAARSGAARGPAACGEAHAPDLHGSRLTPRGRVVVALVWLVMAAVAALMVAFIPGDGAEAPVVTTKVMVEPGQTLWRLAGEVQPGADRHAAVAAITSLNDLDSASRIRPGDVLVVPVEP